MVVHALLSPFWWTLTRQQTPTGIFCFPGAAGASSLSFPGGIPTICFRSAMHIYCFSSGQKSTLCPFVFPANFLVHKFAVFFQFIPCCVGARSSRTAVRLGTGLQRVVSAKLSGCLCRVSAFLPLSTSKIASSLSRCYWTTSQELAVTYCGWSVVLRIQIAGTLTQTWLLARNALLLLIP